MIAGVVLELLKIPVPVFVTEPLKFIVVTLLDNPQSKVAPLAIIISPAVNEADDVDNPLE
jgi:hypothetical protein